MFTVGGREGGLCPRVSGAAMGVLRSGPVGSSSKGVEGLAELGALVWLAFSR